MDATINDEPPKPRGASALWLRGAIVVACIVLAYAVVTYLLIPALWVVYAKRHPALENLSGITYTHDEHPGDPINVALIGSEDDLKAVLRLAGWFPADPLALASDLKIAADTVLKRPYDNAPVSNLYLWGRKEDLAFEQPVGDNPRERHHVRFWKSAEIDDVGRPLWAGSVTFDERVGFSHTTGQITHHIAPDVDAERDRLFETLKRTGKLPNVQTIAGFHKAREGRNGGGDLWRTDGALFVGTIAQ
jgi:LssY C-terminus